MTEISDEVKTVVSLMSASHSMTNSMTEQVIKNLQFEIKMLKAERTAIRVGVALCFDGPYMPRESTIIGAVHPSLELIESFMEETE